MKYSNMKKAIIISNIIYLLLSLFSGLAAQTNSTWVGGTPGRSTDWNCPTNWKENHVPDEFSQVFIPPNCNYYPVIKSTIPPIDALLVEGGGRVIIDKKAKLTIIGATGRLDGATFLGQIINQGILELEYLKGMFKQSDPKESSLANH
jgi:hypothetical protein